MTTSLEIISADKGRLGREINKAIKALDGLDKTWHRLCVSALAHYSQHSDTQYITMIAKGTSKYKQISIDEAHVKPVWDGRSIRGASIRKWFEELGGLSWSTAADGGEGGYRMRKGLKKIDPKSIDLEFADANPFYSYYKEEEPGEPDIWDGGIKEIIQLRDKAHKMLENGTSKSGKLVLPLDAKAQRAVASSLINSLTEFLSVYGEHANPDKKVVTKPKAVKAEVIKKADRVARTNKRKKVVAKPATTKAAS